MAPQPNRRNRSRLATVSHFLRGGTTVQQSHSVRCLHETYTFSHETTHSHTIITRHSWHQSTQQLVWFATSCGPPHSDSKQVIKIANSSYRRLSNTRTQLCILFLGRRDHLLNQLRDAGAVHGNEAAWVSFAQAIFTKLMTCKWVGKWNKNNKETGSKKKISPTKYKWNLLSERDMNQT